MKILLLAPLDSPIAHVLENFLHTEDKITAKAARGFDFLISYGYRHILPKEILDLLPAVNLHISYLPYNRGADPNFWSVWEGTPRGVTIHVMDEGIDTGDILLQKRVEFSNEDTLSTSYDKLQATLLKLFTDNMDDILNGNIKPTPQTSKGTYHNARDKELLFAELKKKRVHIWDTPIKEIIGLAKPPAIV